MVAIRAKRWKMIEHASEHPELRDLIIIITGTTEGKKTEGRPRNSFIR